VLFLADLPRPPLSISSESSFLFFFPSITFVEEELFEMRSNIIGVIEVLQKDFDADTCEDKSIDGIGFNISFPQKKKDEERCKILFF
jgi:hypothetical protein